MIRIRAFSFCFSAVLLLCSAVTATAQQAPATRPAPPPPYVPGTPTYELTGGYQLLHFRDSTFPFGLNVDGARHYGSFGLVAEIGFALDSKDEGDVDLSSSAWNFGVGGRWTGFNSGHVWPFAQVLTGLGVLHTTLDVAGLETNETETSFMLQPGVGVNFVVADGFGLVFQVDYRRTFFEELEDVEDSQQSVPRLHRRTNDPRLTASEPITAFSRDLRSLNGTCCSGSSSVRARIRCLSEGKEEPCGKHNRGC
jgi:hypothetical protein